MTYAELSPRLVALLSELNPDAVLWTGLDEAVIGIALREARPVAVYDYARMVDVLAAHDGMDRGDAEEWVDFNIVGAYVGASTPFHVHLDDPWPNAGEE